jgi:hypothetical protein
MQDPDLRAPDYAPSMWPILVLILVTGIGELSLVWLIPWNAAAAFLVAWIFTAVVSCFLRN